jgi:hypothetical protein
MEKVIYTRHFLGRLRRYRVLSETLTHVYLQDMNYTKKRFNVARSYLSDHYTKYTEGEK